MTRLAIFASGGGSNASALIDSFSRDPEVEIALVVTNRSKAGVVQVAEQNHVPLAIIGKEELQDEELVMAVLDEYGIEAIILAGWLLLIPAYLIAAFPNRIVNVHPALLPKFGGKGMWGRHVHQAVAEAGETESGITVHLVNEEYDKGEVIAQYAVQLEQGDSAESIERKVRQLEREHFAQAVKKFVDSIDS